MLAEGATYLQSQMILTTIFFLSFYSLKILILICTEYVEDFAIQKTEEFTVKVTTIL